tara:strand:- start:68 stop:718 length:651 start_codon:yes stop_codon:yes gene_type:complete
MGDYFYHGTDRAAADPVAAVEGIKKRGLKIGPRRATATAFTDVPEEYFRPEGKVSKTTVHSGPLTADDLKLKTPRSGTGVVFKDTSYLNKLARWAGESPEIFNLAEPTDIFKGEGPGPGSIGKEGYKHRVNPKHIYGYVVDGKLTLVPQKSGFLEKFGKVGKLGGKALAGGVGLGLELIGPSKLNQGDEIYPRDPNPRESVMHPDYDKGFLEKLFK